jgi:hypothetical protein
VRERLCLIIKAKISQYGNKVNKRSDVGWKKPQAGTLCNRVVGFPMRSGITSRKEFGSVFEGTPDWAEVVNRDIDE